MSAGPAWLGSVALSLLGAPLVAQEVSECGDAGGIPDVTALVEPWEETSTVLAAGAVRLAVLEGEQGSRRLLVLTLPPEPAPATEPAPEGDSTATPPDASPSLPSSPSPRRCRIVAEGGLGFADLDLGGIGTDEDPEAATLTVTLPALRFIPESTELEPVTLLLTFGVADDALSATVE